ncbi:MAG: hypothetical protein ACOC1F_00925 [Myxococcota bacterium]
MTASPRVKGRARRLRRWLSRASVCLCLVVPAIPAIAIAEEPDCEKEPDKCARAAFEEGVKAYQEGAYTTALAHFRRAYEYRPHPAIALNLGLAEAKTGMLLEAIDRFDQIIAHPDASDKLRESAKREKELVQGSLAVLTLDVAGDNEVTATVDGEPMQGNPPVARLNPGLRHVRVIQGSQVLLDRKVILSLGERLRIAVQRSSEVKLVVPQKPKPKPKPTHSGMDPIWFYGAAGASVALGAATIWSGLDTKSAYDEYERDLPTLPQEEINRRVDEGNGKETRTNVLLGLTTVAAAGTAVLGVWFVDWSDADAEPGNVALTPGGVLVRGRF